MGIGRKRSCVRERYFIVAEQYGSNAVIFVNFDCNGFNDVFACFCRHSVGDYIVVLYDIRVYDENGVRVNASNYDVESEFGCLYINERTLSA